MKGFAKAAGAIAVGAAATSQAADQTTGTPEPCIAKNPYGGGPNTGITLPPYYRPTPSVANANTFFPGMEELGADEMCINPARTEPRPTRSILNSCNSYLRTLKVLLPPDPALWLSFTI
jgi:ribonuclease Z